MTAAQEPVFEVLSSRPDETHRLGNILGSLLVPGDLVLLAGGIGAGKTTFARGLASGLGVKSPIHSPTFTLVMEHEFSQSGNAGRRLYHIDLYRMAKSIDELQTIGLGEYLDDPEAVVVVEWPERATAFLPGEYLLVHLSMQAELERLLLFLASGSRYVSIAERMQREIAGSDS